MAVTLMIERPFACETYSIEWISLECREGNFVVGPGHLPLIAVLSPEGLLAYRSAGVERSIEVPSSGGIVHVLHDEVMVFLCA